MRPTRIVQSTWFLMIVLQTIGSVDAKRKLPAPRQFVIVSVLWSILFLLADTGLSRLAARLALLITLAAAVLGPFGARLVQFLNTVTQQFGVPPTVASSSAPGGATAPFVPGPAPSSPSAPSVRPRLFTN